MRFKQRYRSGVLVMILALSLSMIGFSTLAIIQAEEVTNNASTSETCLTCPVCDRDRVRDKSCDQECPQDRAHDQQRVRDRSCDQECTPRREASARRESLRRLRKDCTCKMTDENNGFHVETGESNCPFSEEGLGATRESTFGFHQGLGRQVRKQSK